MKKFDEYTPVLSEQELSSIYPESSPPVKKYNVKKREAYPVLDSGVYRISCILTDTSYIGSSGKMRKRREIHLNALKSKKHPNKKLQAAFNKYGEGNFTFEILERCLKATRREREDFWINQFIQNGAKLFNKNAAKLSTSQQN